VSRQLRLTNANLPGYLRERGLLSREDPCRVEPVGDGNINWVRRVRAASACFVVKQARPALERFPQYRVSTARIVFEARFYQTVEPLDEDRLCPRVLFFDPEQRVLVLEDLGDAERLDRALARGLDARAAAAALAGFLGRVHRATRGAGLADRFDNDEMRRLHGDHIFLLPFRENDFPLSTRVAARAAAIRAERELVTVIDALHASYLEQAEALVHGDVQPSNVLLTPQGPRLLDPEIAHLGDPAFDVGQLLGHLLLPAAARGEPQAAQPALRAAWAAYREASGTPPAQQLERVAGYAGVELLRRTLGAARVPAVARDASAMAVLDAGLSLIRGGLELG